MTSHPANSSWSLQEDRRVQSLCLACSAPSEFKCSPIPDIGSTPTSLRVENDYEIVRTQSLAKTAKKTRNVMRIHRTGIALTLALSFVPACRSASVAHRPASSIRVASHPVETRRIQSLNHSQMLLENKQIYFLLCCILFF